MSLDVARDASPPVSSPEELLEVFRRAEKPRAAHKVGMEHEKISVRAGTVEPVPFEGPNGIRALLERTARFGYEPLVEDGRPIAAKAQQKVISLEPGGQLELSGRPFACAHECLRETQQHVAQMRALGRELGIRFLSTGYRPFGGVAGHPWMPKGRYTPMRDHLGGKGKLAHEMMLLTATVQANYDFASEADMAAKLRAAMSVSPLVTAMFANSFLVDGKDSGFASWRYHVWTDVDPDRCGLLPFVFEEGFGYRRWLEWTLDVPMIFLRRGGAYLPARGTTFRRFLAEGLDGHRATLGDYEDHLTTLFPEVRLKGVIEVRGADAGSVELNAALPALWMGILYDEGALAAAWALLRELTFAERLELQAAVARRGLAARCRKGSVLDLARELLAIADAGLAAQRCEAHEAASERVVLDPLRELLARGRCPADDARATWERAGRDPVRFAEAIAY